MAREWPGNEVAPEEERFTTRQRRVRRSSPLHPPLDPVRCVACGDTSPDLARRAQCPTCACDFRARPPRTYAEMEGLLADPRARAAFGIYVAPRQRQTARWCIFGIVVVTGLAVTGFLTMALIQSLG